jgi:hypothetical protein
MYLALKRTDSFFNWFNSFLDLMAFSTKNGQNASKYQINTEELKNIRWLLGDGAPVVQTPDNITDNEVNVLLADHAPEILSAELQNWCHDKKYWPRELNYGVLLAFFKIQAFEELHNLNGASGKIILILSPTAAFQKMLNDIIIKLGGSKSAIQKFGQNIIDKMPLSFSLPPEVISLDEAFNYIKNNYFKIYTQFLGYYFGDKITWPEIDTFTHFLEYFKCDFHTQLLKFNSINDNR